ncbi:ABC transporter substrate binding protein [Kiloniella sp. EL199]|uniref:ABC transporter substrate binding protein n=1 Tax=Kiloniella sp. EL199 TaxID=2107581 RepID=UPI0013C49B63|nr:ABC transporter substrate binding protein [Kiloniella sp. EL199]
MSLSALVIRNTCKFIKPVVPIYMFLACIFGLNVIDKASAAPVKRIVIVETMTIPLIQSTTNWYLKKMNELGYVEGDNIQYVILNAEGSEDKAGNILANELNAFRPNLVMTIATLASRASRLLLKDTDIPQVFVLVADPVQEGFVTTLGGKSGTNITGRTHVIPPATKIEVVKQAMKRATQNKKARIGIINSTYPSAIGATAQLLQLGKNSSEFDFINLNFKYHPGADGKQKMQESAMRLLKERRHEFDYLWLAAGPSGSNPVFLKALQETGIPIIFGNNALASKYGAMISIVSGEKINGTAAAKLVDQIFKGESPGNIPITQPDTYIVSVNITTATKVGTVIPSSLLKLAGKNIYR